ncbi:MAG: NRDE family protein [Acidobacteriota bacterium]
MCTVTIVPYDDGFRLVCNRDERRDRQAALAPSLRHFRRNRAIFPVDPAGGGTWVGVNGWGLAAALLNRKPESAAPRRNRSLRSRGLIIPGLLDAGSWTDALDMAAQLDPGQFDLFRLVLAQRMVAAVVTSDGRALSIETIGISGPFMLTSSSLGDAVVEAPRRRLFEQLVVNNAREWLPAQTRFHAHQWRSRTDISVNMERPDARTVSRTVIDVTSQVVGLCYESLGSSGRRTDRAA